VLEALKKDIKRDLERESIKSLKAKGKAAKGKKKKKIAAQTDVEFELVMKESCLDSVNTQSQALQAAVEFQTDLKDEESKVAENWKIARLPNEKNEAEFV
jgi:hypothetical protein